MPSQLGMSYLLDVSCLPFFFGLLTDFGACRLAVLFVCIWLSNAVLSVKLAIGNVLHKGQHQRKET